MQFFCPVISATSLHQHFERHSGPIILVIAIVLLLLMVSHMLLLQVNLLRFMRLRMLLSAAAAGACGQW
jgi:hypothetical protein